MNGVANGVYGGDLPNQINTPWIDFSQQSTYVGWSSFSGRIYKYKIVGNIVYVSFSFDGTSNSTSTTFTLPILPKASFTFPFSLNADSGIYTIQGFGINTSGNIITCYKPTSTSNLNITTNWTASGFKQISGQFFYEI
jgi:hypothetical protein